ncbi:hypothetical protein PINS_up005602 [Pythium insidiosum]|nr:hypothetical protein PINS_up005602 [Pythium insidiosum]
MNREQLDVTGASVRNLMSNRALTAGSSSSSTTFSSTALGLASSRRVFRRRSSSTDQTLSLLTPLSVPLESITDNVHDMETWLDVMWAYASRVGSSVESHARDLFNLPSAETDSPQLSLSMRPAAPLSIERFGWRRMEEVPQAPHAILRDVSLQDVTELLRYLVSRCNSLSEKVETQRSDAEDIAGTEPSSTDDGGTGSEQWIECQCRVQMKVLLTNLLCCIRQFFEDLLRQLIERIQANAATTRPLSVASLESITMLEHVKSVLTNRVPEVLWSTLSISKTCGLSSLDNISLDTMFAHL